MTKKSRRKARRNEPLPPIKAAKLPPSAEVARRLEVRLLKHAHAAEMRDNMTPAEALLWPELSAEDMDKYGFKAQVVCQGYILDFYSKKAKLAVEVDGGYHLSPEQSAKDRARDGHLARAGIKTLRFTNEQVAEELFRVRQAVIEISQERSGWQHPSMVVPRRPGHALPSKRKVRTKREAPVDIKWPPLPGIPTTSPR